MCYVQLSINSVDEQRAKEFHVAHFKLGLSLVLVAADCEYVQEVSHGRNQTSASKNRHENLLGQARVTTLL